MCCGLLWPVPSPPDSWTRSASRTALPCSKHPAPAFIPPFCHSLPFWGKCAKNKPCLGFWLACKGYYNDSWRKMDLLDLPVSLQATSETALWDSFTEIPPRFGSGDEPPMIKFPCMRNALQRWSTEDLLLRICGSWKSD